MGNDFDIDLSRFSCSCLQSEEGCLEYDLKTKNAFQLCTNAEKETTLSDVQRATPGGLDYPNDNMIKSALNKWNEKKEEMMEFNIVESNQEHINVLSDNFEQRERDIKDFDKNTDYFLLANQIYNAINELKLPIPPSENEKGNNNFENIIKKAGKKADKICFNDIIKCIKKI